MKQDKHERACTDALRTTSSSSAHLSAAAWASPPFRYRAGARRATPRVAGTVSPARWSLLSLLSPSPPAPPACDAACDRPEMVTTGAVVVSCRITAVWFWVRHGPERGGTIQNRPGSEPRTRRSACGASTGSECHAEHRRSALDCHQGFRDRLVGAVADSYNRGIHQCSCYLTLLRSLVGGFLGL